MAKFMFLYRGCDSGAEPSPEEMQQLMQAWTDWISGGAQAGWMLDGGDALNSEMLVALPDGSVTDGPFAESKELVGGYSMVQADSLEAASALTKGCPFFATGGSIEVRQLSELSKPDVE